MADVFISYSRTDARFVEKVAGQLSAANISTWVDKEGIEAGDRWRVAITQALDRCRWCLLVLSPRSMASPQVAREVNLAADKGRPIVPVVVEPCDIADELQYALAGLHRIDFTAMTFDDGMSEVRQALGATAPARSRVRTEFADDRDDGTVGRGLRFPLSVNGRGGIDLADEGASVDGAIAMILRTLPGERVGRPELGCDLLGFVFAEPTPATLSDMSDRVRAAIDRWEPRANDVEVTTEPSRRGAGAGTFAVVVRYRVRGTNEARELRMELALL